MVSTQNVSQACLSPSNRVQKTIELTSCQQAALVLLEGPDNVFLTGVAGSGKSFLLQHYLRERSQKTHPIVASTGAAAVLAKGVTFHSYFGLGIMEGGFDQVIKKALKNKRVKSRLKNVITLVIDEVSMITGQAFKAAETICREVRQKNIPWGGIKVIAVGDFAQLPPVNVFGTKRDWTFLSETWEQSHFKCADLKTVMRTQDAEFLEILNHVRNAEITDKVITYLNALKRNPDESFQGTLLFPHKLPVEKYNLDKLTKLDGEVFNFATEYSGEERYLEQIKKSAPLPEMLQIKMSALVMIRRNDPMLEYINGSLGTVTGIDKEELEIKLLNGKYVVLEKESFSYMDADGKEVAWAKNFPINLAWATTIHKSQGMTLDRVAMDLSKVFEAGQAYVALSRVRSPEGLYLIDWNPKAIKASEEVKSFYATSKMNHIG